MAGEPLTVPDGGGTAPPPPGEAERKLLALTTGVRQPGAPPGVRVDPADGREVRGQRRAIVRGSLRDAPRASLPPVLAVPSGVALLAFLPLLAFVGPWSAAGLSLALLAILGFPRVLGAAEAWLLRVEREWLRALPFPVRGYLRVLGDAPEEERRLRVRVRFRGAAPEREVVDGFLRRVHVPATAHPIDVDGSTWTAESGPIRTTLSEEGSETNVSSLSWMRSVIDSALIPLHAAHPLRGVEFGGGDPGE